MVNRKFDFVAVGQVKELLNIGWSVRKIKQHMLKYGAIISVEKSVQSKMIKKISAL